MPFGFQKPRITQTLQLIQYLILQSHRCNPDLWLVIFHCFAPFAQFSNEVFGTCFEMLLNLPKLFIETKKTREHSFRCTPLWPTDIKSTHAAWKLGDGVGGMFMHTVCWLFWLSSLSAQCFVNDHLFLNRLAECNHSVRDSLSMMSRLFQSIAFMN